jgi:octaprenyl-diphosphate synthase
MLGGATREQQEALWDYGVNIGMAFQLVDDLLDFTGDEHALGKPVGGALREGTMTLPVIHLYAGGAARLDEWREIRTLRAEARSLEYARNVAWEFVERAKTALNAFPPSDARDARLYLPDYVLSRDR